MFKFFIYLIYFIFGIILYQIYINIDYFSVGIPTWIINTSTGERVDAERLDNLTPVPVPEGMTDDEIIQSQIDNWLDENTEWNREEPPPLPPRAQVSPPLSPRTDADEDTNECELTRCQKGCITGCLIGSVAAAPANPCNWVALVGPYAGYAATGTAWTSAAGTPYGMIATGAAMSTTAQALPCVCACVGGGVGLYADSVEDEGGAECGVTTGSRIPEIQVMDERGWVDGRYTVYILDDDVEELREKLSEDIEGISSDIVGQIPYDTVLADHEDHYGFMYDKKRATMDIQYDSFRGPFSGTYDKLTTHRHHHDEDDTETAPLIHTAEHDVEFLLFDVICKPVKSCFSSICNSCLSTSTDSKTWTKVLHEVDNDTFLTFLSDIRTGRINLMKMMIFDSNPSEEGEVTIKKFANIIFPQNLRRTSADIDRRYHTLMEGCLCRSDLWSRRGTLPMFYGPAWHNEKKRAIQYALQLIDLEDENIDNEEEYRGRVNAIHDDYVSTSPDTLQLRANYPGGERGPYVIATTPEDLKRPFIQGLLRVYQRPEIDITYEHRVIIQEIFEYRSAIDDGAPCNPFLEVLDSAVKQCVDGSNCYINQGRYDHTEDTCTDPDGGNICPQHTDMNACTSSKRSAVGQSIEVTFTEKGDLGLTLTFNDQTGTNELSAVTPSTRVSHPQLKVGLILQSVEGTPVSGMSYQDVIYLIRASDRPLEMSFVAQSIEVTFTEEGDLGLTLKFNKQTGNNELSAVTPDTLASHPQMKVGLILQNISGEPVSGLSHEEVIGLIRASDRPLEMSFDTKENLCVWTPKVQFICESDISHNTELLQTGKYCSKRNNKCTTGRCIWDQVEGLGFKCE